MSPTAPPPKEAARTVLDCASSSLCGSAANSPDARVEGPIRLPMTRASFRPALRDAMSPAGPGP
jgi:hypothetical protein